MAGLSIEECMDKPTKDFREKLDSLKGKEVAEHYLDGTPCECDSMKRMYSDSGKLSQEFPVVNGMANGLCRTYYDSGAVFEEFTMVNDELHGVMKTFYRNETLRLENSIKNEPYYLKLAYWETPYENGKKQGIEKGYFEDGVLVYEGKWDNGQIVLEKTYHENGSLAVETPFSDREFNGVVKFYYPSGKLFQEIPFVDGMIHGMRVIHHSAEPFSQDFYTDDHFFDIDQNPSWGKQTIPYADGKKNGIEAIYDANGKLFNETTWECGKQNGIDRGYDESTGKVFWEGEFVNGVHHGLERTYYDDGSLKTEGMRMNGKKNGVEKLYDESGRLRRITHYMDGKKDGEIVVFDENGSLIHLGT